jgi:hypothetical protein
MFLIKSTCQGAHIALDSQRCRASRSTAVHGNAIKVVNICVVGLGCVGLPRAIQLARSNVSVTGLEIDQSKVDLINRGVSYLRHITGETIANELHAGRLCASTDFGRIERAEAVSSACQLHSIKIASQTSRSSSIPGVRSQHTSQKAHWSFWNQRPILRRLTKISVL